MFSFGVIKEQKICRVKTRVICMNIKRSKYYIHECCTFFIVCFIWSITREVLKSDSINFKTKKKQNFWITPHKLKNLEGPQFY